MKGFIDRIFKSKKLKEELRIEENKRLIAAQIEVSIKNKIIQDQATEAAVEAIIEEAKEVIKNEEVNEVFTKPGHYFADCNCFKCVRWRNQDAK